MPGVASRPNSFPGGATRWRTPLWYRALTAHLLPSRLRQDFGLPYGPSERRSAERALTVLRRLYPWMPTRLRYVGPYHEALPRLPRRELPRALTRVLNPFSIAQNSMPVGG